MKRFKVNPVFEGSGRKRSKGESSGSATMTARGRRANGVRATRALAINPDNRSMVTRSMVMIDEPEEETWYEVDITQAPVQQVQQQQPEVIPVENKGDDEESLVLDDSPKICNSEVQVPQQQQPVDEVVPVENKGDDEESLVLDDLPKICNSDVQVLQQLQPVDEVVPEENKGDNEESLVLDGLPKISNYEVQVPQPQQQQKEQPVVEVAPIENKGDDKESLVLPKISNPEVQVPKEQEQKQQQPVDEVVPVENKGEGEESLVLDDLPVICNYEEAWPCFNDGNGYGWNSYEFWEPFGDVNFEPVWDDDLWNFKDNDGTKKL